MKKARIAALLIGGALHTGAWAQGARVERIDGGVAVTPTAGPAARVAVTVHGDGIMHVVATPRGVDTGTLAPSLMAPTPPVAGHYAVAERAGHVRIAAAAATADIDVATGRVRFLDPAGRELLAESGATAFAPTDIDGKRFVTVSQQFNRGSDEGLYGLGQHQQAKMDMNGEDVALAQHNMDIAVPFVVSTRGYGLL